MKRLRSSEDLDSYGDKCKDPNPNSNPNPNRSSSSQQYRSSFYYKSENVRKGGLMSSSSASSRYDRDRSAGAGASGDDDREGPRVVRKRSEHDFEGFDRRKGFDRYSGESRGGGGGGYDRNLMHRSESFCGGSSTSLSLSASRREFPKGFRSERSSSASDRSRREGSVSSWRRFGSNNNNGNKDSEERSRIGLRDVKSPSWSRDSVSAVSERMNRVSASAATATVAATTVSNSGSSPLRTMARADSRTVVTATKEENSNKSKSKSKSPSWSRESGASEQSRSVDVEMVKKSEEEAQVESGSSSEMEEGELEPEPEPEPEPEAEPEREPEPEPDSGLKVEVETESEGRVHENKEDGAEVLSKEEEIEVQNMEGVSEVNDVGKEVDIVEDSEPNSVDESGGGSGDEAVNDDGCGGDDKEECVKEDGECVEEEGKNDRVVDDKSLKFEEECGKQDKGLSIDLEAKAEDVEVEVGMPELNKEVGKVNGGDEVNLGREREEGLSQNFKDKGKSVSIEPTHVVDSAEDGVWIERESREYETCRDSDDMEGPSTRGFDLFTSSPVRREEKDDRSGVSKQKEEKLVLEPFDLSLSLPNVLLPIGAAHDSSQAPGSPSQARSVQSLSTFRTNSDGFTASMSFSGSQSFFHNPSCSLTQTSMDNFEQSVGSRPIFQGIDQASQGAWQGQSQNEFKQKDISLYQRSLMNGNGSLNHSQVLQGSSNGQAVQGQQHRVLEGSSKIGNGLERQLSFHRQLSGQSRHNDDVRSPSQSVGSHDIGSNYSFEKKRRMKEKSSGSLYRSSSQKEHEQGSGGAEYVEKIIARIIEEPIHVMARKFHEMTSQAIVRLKESINDIMLSVDKRAPLFAVQKALQNRSDITLEALLKSHRAQLEILVALRTGLPDYLHQDNSVTSTHLGEVFLNLKCRNLACKNSLPVDECDCKVCGQKNGFCSACMCLVCSKFDMASKTCSWVGCDVCLHWCHTDCALRKSYIMNGISAKGVYGMTEMTEMQFHCVACDHPSELFGFVNEVFQTFAKEWTVETLSRELDYVKRIFCESKDMRGRRLHEIADQMLARLANKSDLPEVCSHILAFLREADTPKLGKTPISSGKEQGKESNGIAGPSQDPTWLKSVYSEKAPQLERAASIFPRFSYDQSNKRNLETELQTSIQKEPVFDELESLVRVKEAEAKMFQARADEARRDAEGLKRIAIAKKEKSEEEYVSRIAKLRLAEAEETRKQKIEEVQALERAHREYSDMKLRMQADIKDLLLKMEATRQS